MPEAAISEYFYGDEAEQFIYFRIPRQLITDPRFKHLSTDAKLLYGMLLDRMSLSVKNGWYDEDGLELLWGLAGAAEEVWRLREGGHHGVHAAAPMVQRASPGRASRGRATPAVTCRGGP